MTRCVNTKIDYHSESPFLKRNVVKLSTFPPPILAIQVRIPLTVKPCLHAATNDKVKCEKDRLGT